VTSLWRTVREAPSLPTRSNPTLGLGDLLGQIDQLALFGGLTGGTLAGNEERVEGTFAGYVQGAYKRNGVVFACMAARMLMFSEARFKFRQQRAGRPGDLFGTPALKILETPWANGTTGALLSRMIQDADLAGNFYAARRPGPSLRRMQPDRVTIILGSRTGRDVDAEVVGYAYAPNPNDSGQKTETYLVEDVVHFAPMPDPAARFRGMSWLEPVIREVMADSAATTHKLKFFENGATPNLVVSLGDQARMAPDVFEQWVDKFESQHTGLINAYKTLYLAAGASAQVVGSDMKQVDFKVTQGAGETRIAAAAGVPPSVVGLSEGLQGSSLNAGNFSAAIRRFADMTLRPLWREAAASLALIIDVPGGSELWYDDRDISALQQDQTDAAAIQQTQAITIRELINAGYKPETVVAAVMAGDYGLLQHTGLVSVQLQEPGTSDSGAAASNGNGQSALPAST
jgi:phage portal protein BeeE